MAEPWTELPTDEAPATDERTTLMAFLDYLRVVLARKAEGLTDEQARVASCPPSDLTMLGLVRHLTEVERVWARRSFEGATVENLYCGAAHPENDPDGDFHPPPEATLADALAAYWAEIGAADRIYAAAGLEDIELREQATYSLRWILVHLVEEYARHCGHADLIRQAIDGITGD